MLLLLIIDAGKNNDFVIHDINPRPSYPTVVVLLVHLRVWT